MHTARKLVLALFIGVIAGAGFWGTTALANHQFPDVSSVSAYHGDVQWVTDQAIAGGFPDGRFHPRDAVNRQQAARWLRRFNQRFTVVTETSNPPAQTAFQLAAECPAGTRPLSGGARTDGAGLFLVNSALDPINNSWRAYWAAPAGANVNPTELTVNVLCGPGL